MALCCLPPRLWRDLFKRWSYLRVFIWIGDDVNLDRLETLIGTNKVDQLSNLNICIVGIGGVGGYALESLVRCGVKNITIIDSDVIDKTNLNRQIISNSKNIGMKKVEAAKERAILINPDIKINDICKFLNKDNISKLINKDFDYVVDACDSIETKIHLIKYCYINKIKIISSMGTAKKLDATKLKISTLNKTNYCPFARKLRRALSNDEQKYTKVVYSTETSLKTKELGSISYLPAIAGLLICNIIVNDMINNTNLIK